MAKVWLGATGTICKGHVLDVNKRAFEETLRSYDPQLYVAWNSRKLKGWGCWEIRRAPTKMTAIHEATYQGMAIVRLDYIEHNIVSHILDCAFLNYDAVRKLKEMDTWGKKDWAANLEYEEERKIEKGMAESQAELKYAARHYKKEIRDLKDALLSGTNPHQIVKHMTSKAGS